MTRTQNASQLKITLTDETQEKEAGTQNLRFSPDEQKAALLKQKEFEEKFPSTSPMRQVASDNHLDRRVKEYHKRAAIPKRKSMSAMANLAVDNSVWMDAPLFASMGIGATANKFYQNVKNRSQLKLARGESIDKNTEKVLDYYEKTQVTSYLIINVIQGIMHSIMFGWAIGVLNTTENSIESRLNIVTNEFAWLNGTFALGAIPGSFLASKLSDRWGRKSYLLFNDVIWITCGVIFYFAVDYYAYLTARFLIGVASGGAGVVVPTFLGEIAPVAIRGVIGASIQVSLTMGILASQVIAKPSWGISFKFILGLNGILGLVQLCTAFTFSESPAWLILKDRDDESEVILKQLRGRKDVDMEMLSLQRGVEAKASYSQQEENAGSRPSTALNDGGLKQPILYAFEPTFYEKLQDKIELRKAVIIAVMLQLGQQFSGINSVFFYSAKIFDQAGVDPWLGTVLASGANVFGVLLAVLCVESLGRKMCMNISGVVMMIAGAASTIGLFETKNSGDSFWQWWIIAASMVYVVGFEFGFGPIPWTIAAEVTSTADLSTVQGIGSAANGVGTFIIANLYPVMQKNMDAYNQIPFIVVSGLTLVFVWLYVPETKGLEVEQTIKILRGEMTEEEVRKQSLKKQKNDLNKTVVVSSSLDEDNLPEFL